MTRRREKAEHFSTVPHNVQHIIIQRWSNRGALDGEQRHKTRRQSKAQDSQAGKKKIDGDTDSRRQGKAVDSQAGKRKQKKMTEIQILGDRARQ
jgi:hypothetical protein